MSAERKVNPLSAEFLYQLYATALHSESLCGVIAQHMRPEYRPDRSFQKIQQAIAAHFRTYKQPPSYAVLTQTFVTDYDAIELLDTFRDYDEGDNPEAVVDMLEAYIKGVRLQAVYGEVGKLYNQSRQDEAEKVLKAYAQWPGETFGAGFTEKTADSLLRADLRKKCVLFRRFGRDSLLLGVLAYNVGEYRLLGDGIRPKSRLIGKLEAEERDIRAEYVSFRKWMGLVIPSIERRRKAEFDLLYEKTKRTYIYENNDRGWK